MMATETGISIAKQCSCHVTALLRDDNPAVLLTIINPLHKSLSKDLMWLPHWKMWEFQTSRQEQWVGGWKLQVGRWMPRVGAIENGWALRRSNRHVPQANTINHKQVVATGRGNGIWEGAMESGQAGAVLGQVKQQQEQPSTSWWLPHWLCLREACRQSCK